MYRNLTTYSKAYLLLFDYIRIELVVQVLDLSQINSAQIGRYACSLQKLLNFIDDGAHSFLVRQSVEKKQNF